jgi:hypothetical protein
MARAMQAHEQPGFALRHTNGMSSSMSDLQYIHVYAWPIDDVMDGLIADGCCFPPSLQSFRHPQSPFPRLRRCFRRLLLVFQLRLFREIDRLCRSSPSFTTNHHTIRNPPFTLSHSRTEPDATDPHYTTTTCDCRRRRRRRAIQEDSSQR